MREVFQVTPNVWCIREPSYLACFYLVRTGTGVVLIDAGMVSDADYVFSACQTAFGANATIVAILLTHWHNDHAAGAADLAMRAGVPAYFHERENPYFSGDSKRGGALSSLADRIPEFGPLVLLKGLVGNSVPRPLKPAKFVQDGDELLGEFAVIETPGHTSGHTSYFHHPSRTLFAGDALAVVGKQLRLMSRFVTPDRDRALASTIKCLDREIHLICPGHRYPLSSGVEHERTRFLKILSSRTRWPLFG